MFIKKEITVRYFLKLLIWYLLTLGVYLLYKYVSIKSIHSGAFDDLPSAWFYVMDMILNFIFGLLLIYLFRPKLNFSLTVRKYKIVVLLFFIAFLFRLFENPFNNIDLLINYKKLSFGNEYISFYDLFFIFVTIVFIGPFVEELFYRKLLLKAFSSKLVAIIFSSILFAIFHLASTVGIYVFISTFLFGIVSCLIYYKYGLFYSFTFHLSYNLLFFINFYLINLE